ncbi:MAG: OmpA family protein [Ekhidna sp.]|nr:OmpA family protein [Ekhidna sp.]
MRSILTILIICTCVLGLFGQSVPRLTRIADDLYDNHRYLEAIEFYQKISKLDKKDYRAIYRLGNCYLKALEYEDAQATFSSLGSIEDADNDYRAQALYNYGSVLMTNSRFKEADSLFAFIISISEDQNLIELARKLKEGCLLALRQQKDRGFEIDRMDEVNSKYHDFGATINPSNGQLVFATTRNLGGVQYQGSQYGGVLPDLTTYEYNKGKWRQHSAQRFNTLNTEWFEGSGSFTMDGKAFYFSSCEGQGGSDCTILVSYLEDDRWTEPEPLNDYVNEAGSENKQPSISATGDTLFFSSDRSGGYGGSDIWMSLRGLEGESWGPAINMGSVINSTENDITPYYSSAFGSLIFASNGHIGYGGYDLYAASGESFYEPELFNLGHPFNSSLDDTYLNISDTLGFLASNREDSKIVDLYSFDVNDEQLFLSLLISGESRIDSRVISKFKDVQTLDLFAFRVEDYQGYDLFEPEKRTKPKPSIILKQEQEAALSKQVSDESKSEVVLTSGHSAGPERSLYAPSLIGSTRNSIDYEHLYFDIESSSLEAASRKALDQLVLQIKEVDISSIEVLAYTDIDGPSDYNQGLSESRGKSVKAYLISKGLSADRIMVRARGEGPLSSRQSWYSKMFSRRAEIIVNAPNPIQLNTARPYAVRYEQTVSQIATLLNLKSDELTEWNYFKTDTIEAGSIIRVGAELGLMPNIRYFLEEKDLRNSFFVYKVKEGDSISSIAEQFDTVEELLMEVNDLSNEVDKGDEIFVYKVD